MTLFRIEAPHFCAGGEIKDQRITWAAPIINYMKGWSVYKAHEYCKKKNWQIISFKIEKN